MRIAAIIPARYDSSRLKGKPLADLCGRPMIWWVYSQVKKSSRIHEVVVATDSEEIRHRKFQPMSIYASTGMNP